MCLWRFSTITMLASIIAPMAIAMPPRLMMFALSPSNRMARNAMRIPIGGVDQAGPVVAVDESHTLGQRRLDLCHFRLHPLDDSERVLAVAHHHPAGHDLAAP